MKHVIKHDLSPDMAKKVATAAFESYKKSLAKYEPQTSWTSDSKADVSFKAKGVKLNGSIELKPSAIELELDVPFLLKPFKNKAMGVVEKEIQEWITKAKNGELE